MSFLSNFFVRIDFIVFCFISFGFKNLLDWLLCDLAFLYCQIRDDSDDL